jgi:radical SAM protein with 4Fe4S-binding SPASM domain
MAFSMANIIADSNKPLRGRIFYNRNMRYFLAENVFLKLLETPCAYHAGKDELYEVDGEAFELLEKAASGGCDAERNEFVDYCLDECILAERPAARRHPVIRKSPVPSLRYLELQVTDRCNLRCRHCFVGEPEGNELTPETVRNILAEFEEMQGLRLLITGGEPLMHSRFDEINGMLPAFAFRKMLFTNGLLLNEKRLSGLMVDEIQISVDGMERGHEILRGKGTFKKAVEAIGLAMSCGFDVSVSTMVHSGNLDEFEEMEKLFGRLGVKDWTVDVPCPTGRLAENEDLSVRPEIGGGYLGYGFGGGMHGGAEGFACGLHLMSVSASGCAAKCSFYSPVGNVDEGLRACWEKIRPVRLEKLSCDCPYVEQCGGGCRFRAEKLTGSPLGRDLFRCFLYDIIK